MNLYITDQHVDSMSGTRIPPSMVVNANVHLVIASSMWEEIWVDVDECIQEGCLRRLPEKSKNIYARVPEKPSRHQMLLLCELYPEQAGSIRKAFLKGENIHGVLPHLWRAGCDPGRGSVPV